MNFVPIPVYWGKESQFFHTDKCLSIFLNRMKTQEFFFPEWPNFAISRWLLIPLLAQKMEGHRWGRKEQNIFL